MWDLEQIKHKNKNLSLCSIKHHIMKIYGATGGTAPCILNLGIRLDQYFNLTESLPSNRQCIKSKRGTC